MIVSALVYAVILAALFQPEGERRKAALCFVIPLMIFEYNWQAFTGESYYVVAAMVATFITILLRFAAPFTRISQHLQLICTISVGLNAFGWALYKLNYQPDLYNFLFIALYSVVLLVMLSGGRKNGVGNCRMDRRRVRVPRHVLNLQGKL